jgi:hypothetical protein
MNPDLFSPILDRRLRATCEANPDDFVKSWPAGCRGAPNAYVVLLGPSPGAPKKGETGDLGGAGRPMARSTAKLGDGLQPMPPGDLQALVEASAEGSPISAADRLDLEHAMELLTAAKPDCRDVLWKRFVFGFDYAEIAAELQLTYSTRRSSPSMRPAPRPPPQRPGR